MAIHATYDDLSDEGLDLLLRIALRTSSRQIDGWNQIGDLVENLKISVTYINDGFWSADIDDSTFKRSIPSSRGKTAKAAIATAVISAYFPDGPAFRAPLESIGEMFKSNFLLSDEGRQQISNAEFEAKTHEKDGKASVYIL